MRIKIRRKSIKEMRKRDRPRRRSQVTESNAQSGKKKKYLILGNLEIRCDWMMIFRKNCKGSCKERVRIDRSDNNTFL